MRRARVVIVLLLPAVFTCHRETPLSQLPVAKAKRSLGTISRPSLTPGDDGVEFRDADPIDILVRQCAKTGDFAPVEARAAELLPQQHDDDRAFDLYQIDRTFNTLAYETGADRLEQALDAWVRGSSTAVAYTARGHFRAGLAGKARGDQWANSVSAGAHEAFQRLLRLSDEDYAKALTLESRDPNPHTGRIQNASGLGRARAALENDYALALKAAPGHYGARMAKLRYLMPKWYGSEDEMLAFAFECTRDAKRHPYAAFVEPDAFREEHVFPETMLRRTSAMSGLLTRSQRPPKEYLSYEVPWRRVSDAYEEFLATHPDHLRARYWYTELAYRTKQWDVFVEQAEVIGNRWVPTSVWDSQEQYRKAAAYAYLIYAYEMKLSASDAVNYKRRAVALEPNDAENRYHYAITLHQLSRIDDAAVQYRRAIALDPKYAEAYSGLIQLVAKTHNCDEVLRLGAASRSLAFQGEDRERVQYAMGFCSRR